MRKDLVYPIDPGSPTWLERFVVKTHLWPGFCPVCGRITLMIHWTENHRDSGWCWFCKSSNRQRQMATILCRHFKQHGQSFKGFLSLRALSKTPIAIYNTEASGAIHDQLSKYPVYTCSEYLGAAYQPGELVNGIRHEDSVNLSFADNSFDLVISADVFEHIPLPYRAHQEVYRVLKPGGRHIFTVPFLQTEYLDDIRAKLQGGHRVDLKSPIYHIDPTRGEGILVYTLFSVEMLVKLKQIGFHTNLYRLYYPLFGILGANGIVFEAIKDN